MGLCRRIAQHYIMAMPLKITIIQWDSLLDYLEEIIGRERCIGCRAIQYHNRSCSLFAEWTTSGLGAHEFVHAYKAYQNLLNLSRGVRQSPLAIRHCCHRQNHGFDKPFIRALRDAETKLMVALHYHPLIKEAHLCNFCYDDAFHYNVDSVVCDEMFLMVDTMEYVSRLRKMQRLFD